VPLFAAFRLTVPRRLGAAVLVAFATACGIPAQAVVQVAPHQAVYRLKLASARSSSAVADVNGQMIFAWKDACDGWTVEQKFQAKFLYAGGEETELNTSYITWEAKDGRAYRFNVRKMVNGALDEELRGNARLDRDGEGTAHYEKPEVKDIPLKPGTLFPTAHTLQMIELAGKGESFFARPVFDGSEAVGATGVTAVMGAAKPSVKTSVKAPALWDGKAIPVHMAFFSADKAEMLPDYESLLMLQENGVVQSILIDYGDFKVAAELEKLESVPRSPC